MLALLSALAQHTQRVRLSALVTGNTYRNPTLLAKTVTALDVVSGGRAQLGVGAGCFGLEHQSLGYEFGTFTDRFEKLEESLQSCCRCCAASARRWTASGITSTTRSTIPRRSAHNGDDRRRRRAQDPAAGRPVCRRVEPDLRGREIPRKLEALASHCENLGRDRAEITVSYLTSACVAPTHEQAVAEFEDFIARQPQAAARRAGAIVGSPDEVAEQFAQLRDTGIDGVTVNAPANGHVEGRVALLGQALVPLFTG